MCHLGGSIPFVSESADDKDAETVAEADKTKVCDVDKAPADDSILTASDGGTLPVVAVADNEQSVEGATTTKPSNNSEEIMTKELSDANASPVVQSGPFVNLLGELLL